MKPYKLLLLVFAITLGNLGYAQKNGNVVAKNHDISDNLDLQAVASIFGDSKDLEDFEKKLNDPSLQISNLDLNQDGYVDYLRVLEVAEGDARVIVIQAVLGQDQFQDVATIELERQRATASNSSTNVNIQIVGNPYIYGPNYIYEPYYYRPPVFFDFFWMASYRPYYSPWYWGYYPTYYSYWAPVPYFRYNRNCYYNINQNNRYVYTDTRRVSRADRMYSNVRGNSLERQNPSRSFTSRNGNVTNRYAFDKERNNTRAANFSNDRSTTTGRATFSGERGNATVTGRQGVESSRNNAVTATNRSGSLSNATRVSETRVRSDFNANRANVATGQSDRLSVPVTTNRVNTGATRVNSTVSDVKANSNLNQSNSRIERSSRTNTSSNTGSFNRNSSSGSINRSSAPSSSRSMGTSAPSRSSGGSSGRSIGR